MLYLAFIPYFSNAKIKLTTHRYLQIEISLKIKHNSNIRKAQEFYNFTFLLFY